MVLEYKLIVTDMDDTLLNSEHKISAENRKSIRKVQKQGVKFVLASGRPSFAMYKFARELKMDKYNGYIISFNGGQLIDAKTKEVIFQEGLVKEDMDRIYTASKELDIAMLLYTEDTIYSNKDDDYVNVEVVLTGLNFKKFDTIEEVYNLGINKTVKCMLVGENSKVKEAEKYMKDKYSDDYYIAISKPIFLEIANKNVDKGKTLTRLGEILNIKNEEMIAVGDGGNDKAMLEVVGMPVAVENAIDDLKKISKFISTSNNNHGLKTVIENFLSKE